MGKMDEEDVGDDLVFGGGDDLTWDVVAKASGVDENAYRTRLTKGKNVMPTSISNRADKVGQKGQSSRKRTHITIHDEKDQDDSQDGKEDMEEEEEEMVDEDFETESNEDEDDYVDLDDDV